jgi:hypothetical protein
MAHLVRAAALASLLVVGFSCGPKTEEEPEAKPIQVTADKVELLADGVDKTMITTNATTKVKLTAARGTFSSTQTTSINLDPGESAEYVTCDSRLPAACAGSVKVTAVSSSDGATGSVVLTLASLENCANNTDDNGDGLIDCQDSACRTYTCALPAGAIGDGICSDSGDCLCKVAGGVGQANESTCADGKDNDCDGKIDCGDTSCEKKPCLLPSGFSGACAAGVCKCPGVKEDSDANCQNGIDDDCDGKVDCEDTECQGKGTTLGKACDALGHLCSAPGAGGTSACTYCPGGQTAESTCGDNKDNDCDGKPDCQDTDCIAVACGANGKKCNATTNACECTGNGGMYQPSELLCGDGFDNDCDGMSDCLDTECKATTSTAGKACRPNGFTCTTAGACACTGNGGAFQAVESNCRDGADNDCDGLADCAEALCQPSGNGVGAVCNVPVRPGETSLDAGIANGAFTCSPGLSGPSTCRVCTVPGGLGETAEGATLNGAAITCGDSKDNDCNGKVDCQDSACTGKACNTAGKKCTSTGDCACENPTLAEGNCGDAIDDDCDGRLDCDDPDCWPSMAFPTKTCGAAGKTCQKSGADAGSCVCSGNGGVAQALETNCSDGKDNDCDGLADCLDGFGSVNCQPVGNFQGALCDAVGNTCSSGAIGPASCAICSGKLGPTGLTDGGTPEPGSENSCSDNRDNDCDGILDCSDTDCDGKRCTTSTIKGGACALVGATRMCTCPGGTTESNCGDNLDNDCDGLVDCADSNCANASCGLNGRLCTGATTQTCQCRGNGGTAQAIETLCGDGFDNDCDGYVDCLDSDCRPAGTVAGKSCANLAATPPRSGNVCDTSGLCVCPGGQAAETLCGDGVDNDCDGLIDCADTTCVNTSCDLVGKRCGATAPSSCSVCGGNGGATEVGTAETHCGDGYDNDCDGRPDCADPDCNAQLCYASTHKCSYTSASVYRCYDTSSTYIMTVTTSPSRIAANGTATSTVTVTLLNSSNQPVNGASVAYVVSPTGTGSISPTPTTTNAQGVATTTFTSAAAGGTATVEATATVRDTGGAVIANVLGTATVEQPYLSEMKVASTQFNIMGVQYSGYNEANIIAVQVLDQAAKPYPSGLSVTFTHQQLGGSFIDAIGNCANNTCTTTALTNSSGIASVTLHSGRLKGAVSVVATATAGGRPGSITASNISIIGAKANSFGISLNCDFKNIPALTNHDCSNSFYGGTESKPKCTVSLADRFNNTMERSTQTTFSTEAGAAGEPQMTTADGKAVGTITVTGYRLPYDVDPDPATNEASLVWDDGCGSRTHNPRDGLATVVVSVTGEEGFVDGSNGFPTDGDYQIGEDFQDLGEPFVDVNDNNSRDGAPLNEPFIDVDGNGTWTPPNGTRDANTTIWTSTRILYTGYPRVYTTSAPANALSRVVDSALGGSLPYPTADASIFALLASSDAAKQTSTWAEVFFTDANLNPPSPRTTYGLSVLAGTATAKYLTSPLWTLQSVEMGYSHQYCPPDLTTADPTDHLEPCENVCPSPKCLDVVKIGNYVYGRWGAVEVKAGATASSSIVVQTSAMLDLVQTNLYYYGSSTPAP